MSSEYVQHPINAFHLLQRTSQSMPKVIKVIKGLKFNYDFNLLFEDFMRAHHGLADLHEYYNLDPLEISKGKFKNVANGNTFFAKSQLNSIDLLNIAWEAKKENYLEGHVNWLYAAMKKAKKEKKDSKFVKSIRYYFRKNTYHMYFIKGKLI